MENTLENKAKFFAQYFGQDVRVWKEMPESLCKVGVQSLQNEAVQESHLQLKPLSAISDEDAIHVASLAHQLPTVAFKIERVHKGKLIHLTWLDNTNREVHTSINDYGCINANWHFLEDYETHKSKSYKVNIGEIQLSSTKPIPYIAIADYLREQGYLIPFGDLSIKELLNRGWAVLEQGGA